MSTLPEKIADKTTENMKTEKERFDHTVSILVKAYLNDTLEHGNCYACAVGNIVANGLKTNLVKDEEHSWLRYRWDNGMPYPGREKGVPQGWASVFCTEGGKQIIWQENLLMPKVKSQIDSTGYTWEELAIIEKAFEEVEQYEPDRMFLGLMNVVSAVAAIHGISLEETEEAKALFVKDGE